MHLFWLQLDFISSRTSEVFRNYKGKDIGGCREVGERVRECVEALGLGGHTHVRCFVSRVLVLCEIQQVSNFYEWPAKE